MYCLHLLLMVYKISKTHVVSYSQLAIFKCSSVYLENSASSQLASYVAIELLYSFTYYSLSPNCQLCSYVSQVPPAYLYSIAIILYTPKRLYVFIADLHINSLGAKMILLDNSAYSIVPCRQLAIYTVIQQLQLHSFCLICMQL